MNQLILGIIILCLGLVFTTIGGYIAKDGWSKFQSKDNTPEINGESVRNNIPTQGDYVVGDKTVLNQPITVAGDFISIANPTDFASTSTFVSLVLNLAKFIEAKKDSDEPIGVDDYLDWLRKTGNEGSCKELETLLSVINQQNDAAQMILSYIADLIPAVMNQHSTFSAIIEHTNMLPAMNSKLDFILDQLAEEESPRLRKEQLAISARVLDILTEGVPGSGVKVLLKKTGDIVPEGTAMVVWLLGTQSPHLMLFDIVGDIHSNRISLILNNDASISLRVYDGDGNLAELKSLSGQSGSRLVIVATWKGKELSLWVNGQHQGVETMAQGLDYLGPVCLIGIDIEGKLSADAVRWTPEGQEVGLNFVKDGIWHGSRHDTVRIFSRVLEEPEIIAWTKDPWLNYR